MKDSRFRAVVVLLLVAILAVVALRNPKPVAAQTNNGGLVTAVLGSSLATCAWPAGFGTNPTAAVVCLYPNGAAPGLAIAFANAGTPGAFVAYGTATTFTGTSPIVVSGNTISCPTCAAGNVVTSFNGRNGAITLSKTDVTSTGIAVTTSVTSTATSAVQ